MKINKPIKPTMLALLATGCMATTLSLQAAQVWFSSSIDGGHYTSTGAPLGDDTIVELGAFAPGFVPTAQNTAEWKQNWHSAARSLYDAQNRWYNGTFTVPNNNGVYATGQQGWIWIYNRSGEWCLFSKPSWTWPSTAGDNLEAPVQWSAEEASISVVGQASTPDEEITTAQVSGATSPSITFEQWATLLFGDSAAAADSDNDGDGVSNFAEYALGSRADLAGSVPSNHSIAFEENGQRYLAVGIDKGWTTGVNFSASLSPDLNAWDSTVSATNITIIEDSATGFIARDSQPIGAREKAFLRLNATR